MTAQLLNQFRGGYKKISDYTASWSFKHCND